MIKVGIELFVELFKFIRTVFIKEKAGDKAVQIASMYDEMQDVLSPTGINRILIYWYHNSGGDISADRPLYVTCIHEVKVDEVDAVKRNYKGLEVDAHYAKMTADIYVNRSVEIHKNTLRKSLLKRIFEEDDVARAKSFFIKHTKKGLWFVSFRSANENYSFDEDFVQVQAIVSTIKRTL